MRLADGTVHELDVMILATGFDAGTGALTRIDIRGREGRSLKEDWGRDIRTTMGMQVHGYPNMFTTAVPLAPSAALCNMTTCLQQQAEWISDCIRYLRGREHSVIEPTAEAEAAGSPTTRGRGRHPDLQDEFVVSWLERPGKPRRVLSYTGGVGAYRRKCEEVAANGYQGFAMLASRRAGASAPSRAGLSAASRLARRQPAVHRLEASIHTGRKRT